MERRIANFTLLFVPYQKLKDAANILRLQDKTISRDRMVCVLEGLFSKSEGDIHV